MLYVANSDENQKVWMVLRPRRGRTPRTGVSSTDVNDQTAAGATDGMKVDLAGNIFATGPGGVWVFGWDGVHLGTLLMPEVTANVAWGGDGRTLYMTASTGCVSRRARHGRPDPGQPRRRHGDHHGRRDDGSCSRIRHHSR